VFILDPLSLRKEGGSEEAESLLVLSVCTRITVLTLLHNSETWVLTKREENQLLVFERKVLRTICGPKIENGVQRRRYNHELERNFDSPNVLNVTKTSKLRYASHMIRRPKDLPQKALFRAKPIGRRNQGRPKSRWADGVNSDSLALGVRS
jgi:hypothetical protein